MTGRVPLTDLTSWQGEGGDCRGIVWITAEWGERKINNRVKVYSESRLIESNLVPHTCLIDGSDMSDGLKL
jgi:hypothetical protein